MSKERLWLLPIIVAGFILRLTLLGEQSLWYDEGVTWMLSQMRYLSDLVRWTAADIQPPLYYVLIWQSYALFGQSEWALRFPSVVFNILTVPLIYVLARRLFARSPHRSLISLLAAALFGLSPLMVYYSQEARMYTLLVFEAALSGYLLLKIIHPAGSKDHQGVFRLSPIALLYALVAAAALYTHYFAAFLLIAHALYAALILRQQRWSKGLSLRVVQMFGVTGLLFVPWLPVLLSRLGDDPSYWPGALKLNEAVRKVLISFTAGETVFEQTGLWLALAYLGLMSLAFAFSSLTKRLQSKQISFNPQSTIEDPQSKARNRASAIRNPQSANKSPKSAIRNPQSAIESPQSTPFLILWLLLPPILILLLSYPSPKFNPRYTMLAWPAFALILAAILARLWPVQQTVGDNWPADNRAARPTPTNSAPTTQRPDPSLPPNENDGLPDAARSVPSVRVQNVIRLSRVLFIAGLLFVFFASGFSLYNWFTNPHFSKDDFKALAQFVQERMAPDETILLSSGHLFPVWAYYFGWDNWTPLPRMQRLDVSRVTDLSIAAEIAAAVEDKEGVWLVTWQDEVIDPNGVVPFWLDLVGRRPIDAGDFWGVGLEHWRLNPRKLERLQEEAIARPAHINFANRVELVGLTQSSDTELALFWRPIQPLPDNLVLSLRLTDKNGFEWGHDDVIGRPGAYLYPPSRWPVGQIVMTRHELPWQTGTPPGLYIAEIGLGQAGQTTGSAPATNAAADFTGWDVLDEEGRPRRRTALLEFINLSDLIRPETGPLPLDDDPLVDLFPTVAVRRTILPQAKAEPGDRVLLALLWQAGEFNHDDISVAFDLVDAAGQTFRVGSSLTPSRRFNLPRWQPGDLVLGQYWLDIPPGAVPGPATIQLHLVNGGGAFSYDELFPIDQLEILPTERNFTPPDPVDLLLEADFSGRASLIGVDCQTAAGTACFGPAANGHITPGEAILLTLYWQAEASFDKNYTVFTHLLGPDETVLVNADHAPPKPTRGWVSGEIIADNVTLTLPPTLSPGDYLLEIGLYNAADPAFQRLPISSGETRVVLPWSLKVE